MSKRSQRRAESDVSTITEALRGHAMMAYEIHKKTGLNIGRVYYTLIRLHNEGTIERTGSSIWRLK